MEPMADSSVNHEEIPEGMFEVYQQMVNLINGQHLERDGDVFRLFSPNRTLQVEISVPLTEAKLNCASKLLFDMALQRA